MTDILVKPTGRRAFLGSMAAGGTLLALPACSSIGGFGLVDAVGVPELTHDEFQALESSLASQPSASATIDGHAPSMIAELEGWPSIPAYHAGDPAIQTNCGSADSGRGCIILHDMWEQ